MTTPIPHHQYHRSEKRTQQTPYLDYILLPFGEVYNYDIQRLNRGDVVEFYGGVLRRVDSVVVAMVDSLLDSMCRAKYNLMSLSEVFKLWEANAGGEGIIYTDRVLVIWLENKDIDKTW